MVRFRKKIFLWIFVGALTGLCCASDENSTNIMKISKTDRGHRAFLKYNIAQQNNSNNTDDITDSFIAYDLQIVVEAFEKLNYSKCGQDALTVMEAITKRELWALQMFDASSKFPVGLLHGSFYQLGNFDECVKLQQPHTNDPIQGQYCLADVEFFNRKKYDGRVARSFQTVKTKPRHVFNSSMYWSICAPSSCSPKEIEIVIDEIFALATEQQLITVRVAEDKCYIREKQPIEPKEIIYGAIVGLFCVFTLLATVFHYYILIRKNKINSIESEQNLRRSTFVEVVLCFSVINTVGKFLTSKSSSLNLDCIGGIKFISMCFIIVGHTCLFMVGGPVQNTSFFEEQTRSFINAILVNSPLLVDTFLLTGAFLLCYLLLLELDKSKGRIYVLLLYIARYVRLTPSYIVVLGFYCTLFYRMSDGPLWYRVKLEQERCMKSWWTNLLYVNNYVNTNYMCMFQSWYLSADYHLFIIAPFIIYPLWRWPKIGKCLLGVATTLSVFVPFIITWVDHLDPTLMIFAPEVSDITQNHYFESAYIKTHMRAGSYFIGLIFGYLIYKIQTEGIKIPKYVIWFSWVFSTVCGFISMSSVIVFYYSDHVYNAFEAAIYASFHRVAWSVSIGWIMIACVTKNAGLVNKFLSWAPFVILSRLTYCAYLCNGFVELYSVATTRESRYMSTFEMGSKALAHLVMTFSLAFVLCILFESPIHGLEKLLLGHSGRRKEKSSHHDQRDNSSV